MGKYTKKSEAEARAMVGTRIGMLTISDVNWVHRGWIYTALCDCGKYIKVTKRKIGPKGITSCGCRHDISGMKFGNLTAIKKDLSPRASKLGRPWICSCVCGSEVSIRRISLIRGERTCCGCINRVNPRPGMKYSNRIDAKVGNLMSVCRKGAKDRLLEFSLSVDEFKAMVMSECFYCGGYSKHLVIDGTAIGICGVDRVDSGLGYTPSNCSPCCSICNDMKRAVPFYEFLARIRNIYENLDLGYLPEDISIYEKD